MTKELDEYPTNGIDGSRTDRPDVYDYIDESSMNRTGEIND